jgi:hypothetical protein
MYRYGLAILAPQVSGRPAFGRPVSGVSDHFGHRGVVLADALVTCGLYYGSPESHLQLQALVQEYSDAAISETTNLPAEFDFAAFRALYDGAYDLGCTLYRPTAVLGDGGGAVHRCGARPPGGLRSVHRLRRFALSVAVGWHRWQSGGGGHE